MKPSKVVVLNPWSMDLTGRLHLCFRDPLTSISFNNEGRQQATETLASMPRSPTEVTDIFISHPS